MSILTFDNVSIRYRTQDGFVYAVNGVDFELARNEVVGIVGESGCGKTTLIKSAIGLLKNGEVHEGEIHFGDKIISRMGERELNRSIRWKDIAFIPQDAMSALDPVYKVGDQFVQLIREHSDLSKTEARARTKELFEDVDLDSDRMNSYPHTLSGGQKQRVIIALALVLDPDVIIADEPTTGLDLVVQKKILELLDRIRTEKDCSILMVSHDIGAVASISDRIIVMYGGAIMEKGSVDDVFKNSSHPYTIGLKNAFPTLEAGGTTTDLVSIPGSPPDLRVRPDSCAFHDRCPFSTDECLEVEPETHRISDRHRIKCHYPEEAVRFRSEGENMSIWTKSSEATLHE